MEAVIARLARVENVKQVNELTGLYFGTPTKKHHTDALKAQTFPHQQFRDVFVKMEYTGEKRQGSPSSGGGGGNRLKRLIHHLIPSARRLCGNNFVFQHDTDPKRTSGEVQRYLANENVNVMKWPAQSLDLNPIENLWAKLIE